MDNACEAHASGRPTLRLEGVQKGFGGKKAVSIETLQLGTYPIEGLIGPNGAGKTTLMRLIMQSAKPDEGTVLFTDSAADERLIVLSDLQSHQVAQLGVVKSNQVTQDFRNLTIWDSLLLAVCGPGHERPYSLSGERMLRREHEATIEGYLELFSFEDPYGFPHSAGEKKLVDLIRCLLLNPRILLLDEPTAGLPADVTNDVMKLVQRKAAEGMSVVVVEHDLDVIWGFCDFVHFMAEGSVLLQGDPQSIRGHRTVVEKYLGGSSV